MSLAGRMGQLTPSLTARERVVLSVRSMLGDQRLDPRVRTTMPDWQVPEANRLVGIANGILHVLLPHALVLQQEVETLQAHYQLLLTLAAWGQERTVLRNALSLLAVVPVPTSEYARLQREMGAEYWPFTAAAELIETFTGSPDEDTAQGELRRLLRSGFVQSRGTGADLEVEIGSLHRHYGEPLGPQPDGAWRYEPVPDAEYAAVRWRVELSSGALGSASDGPGLAPFPLASPDDPPPGGTTSADRARDLLARQVREQTSRCWARLLAIETVAAEAVAILGDPAVVPEAMTSLLATARSGLEFLYSSGAELLALGPLPDADLEFVEELRLGVHRY